MFRIYHFTAGAHGRAPFFRDDHDRIVLLDLVDEAFDRLLIGYCLMDTHVHFVLDGDEGALHRSMTTVLQIYTRGFNRKHGLVGSLLRGRVESTHARNDVELTRMLSYLHKNPVVTIPPIVRKPVYFEWSSAREYAGLSLAGVANLDRARELLGKPLSTVAGGTVPLAGLEAARTPSARPETLLIAAAQTYGRLPGELVSGRRSEATAAARAAFVTLGRLEGYTGPQLATTFGCSRQRIAQLGAAFSVDGVRIARTLIRTPELLARLRTNAALPSWRAATATSITSGQV